MTLHVLDANNQDLGILIDADVYPADQERCITYLPDVNALLEILMDKGPERVVFPINGSPVYFDHND